MHEFMKKAFKKISVWYSIFAGLEIIGIFLLCVFYFLDLYDSREAFNGVNSLVVSLVVISVNIVFIGITLIRLYYLRQKSDLRAAKLIGQDVQEAYNFGMIGLAIVDERDVVIWDNDLFQNRNIKIIDENIFSWEPRLKELKTADANYTVKMSYHSRNYEVKYLKEAKLYIFKDVTDFESISNYSKQKAVVVGLVIIDNFSDIADNSDDSNDTISKIRNAIFDYAKDFKVLLRRFRNDAYFAVCDYASLELMKADQFSLLETVRVLGAKEPTPPTLSIGFAHDFPDVNKLSEMANDAIDIAMSRGGDQAVVSRYGDELVFYGGRTEALETRNKVKVRVLSDSLIATIKLAKNVFVLE